MGFSGNLSTHALCVCSSNEGKSAENVVKAYLSGILVHKGKSVAIIIDNGTEFKNKILKQCM